MLLILICTVVLLFWSCLENVTRAGKIYMCDQLLLCGSNNPLLATLCLGGGPHTRGWEVAPHYPLRVSGTDQGRAQVSLRHLLLSVCVAALQSVSVAISMLAQPRCCELLLLLPQNIQPFHRQTLNMVDVSVHLHQRILNSYFRQVSLWSIPPTKHLNTVLSSLSSVW